MIERARSSRDVERLLDLKPGTLSQRIWRGEIDPPGRVGHSYSWMRADIIKAGWRLLRRDVSGLLGDAAHE